MSTTDKKKERGRGEGQNGTSPQRRKGAKKDRFPRTGEEGTGNPHLGLDKGGGGGRK